MNAREGKVLHPLLIDVYILEGKETEVGESAINAVIVACLSTGFRQEGGGLQEDVRRGDAHVLSIIVKSHPHLLRRHLNTPEPRRRRGRRQRQRPVSFFVRLSILIV